MLYIYNPGLHGVAPKGIGGAYKRNTAGLLLLHWHAQWNDKKDRGGGEASATLKTKTKNIDF